MRILYFSDTHEKHRELKIEPPYPDVLIFGGDCTNNGGKLATVEFVKWFGNYPAGRRILVAGNHDISFYNREPWWDKLMRTYYLRSNINIYLEGQSIEIDGVKFWGSPYSACFKSQSDSKFKVYPGHDSMDYFDRIPEGTDIVINHGPAYKRLDLVPQEGLHLGSIEFLAHLKRVRPKMVLTGHIHESYGQMIDGDVTYYNGALCDRENNLTNEPWTIKI